MAVFQILHTLSYGDAISGEVIALDRALRSVGVHTEIYALNIHPRYKDKAKEFKCLKAGKNDSVILHYSLGSPLNKYYLSSEAKKYLIYHNITPSKWFAGINPRVESDIKEGIKEFPRLLEVSDKIIADSQFNAQEIVDLGFSSEILELPIDPERWVGESNAGISTLLQSEPGPHVLHVGRLAPNKCIEDILKIFYFFTHYCAKGSRLWLVGTDIDTELYSFGLKRFAYELGVDDRVTFTGAVSDEELRSFYQEADLYLCMSDHEGFCLPVIEAMHFDVPVISCDRGALPDTIGKGGILVKEKRHAEIAELMMKVLDTPSIVSKLQKYGQERVNSLSYQGFEKRVRQFFVDDCSKETLTRAVD